MVEWADSYGCSSGWERVRKEAPPEHLCHSVGWLVVESDALLVLVPHITPAHEEIGAEEQGCGDMTIPKSAIRRMVDLVAQ